MGGTLGIEEGNLNFNFDSVGQMIGNGQSVPYLYSHYGNNVAIVIRRMGSGNTEAFHLTFESPTHGVVK